MTAMAAATELQRSVVNTKIQILIFVATSDVAMKTCFAGFMSSRDTRLRLERTTNKKKKKRKKKVRKEKEKEKKLKITHRTMKTVEETAGVYSYQSMVLEMLYGNMVVEFVAMYGFSEP